MPSRHLCWRHRGPLAQRRKSRDDEVLAGARQVAAAEKSMEEHARVAQRRDALLIVNLLDDEHIGRVDDQSVLHVGEDRWRHAHAPRRSRGRQQRMEGEKRKRPVGYEEEEVEAGRFARGHLRRPRERYINIAAVAGQARRRGTRGGGTSRAHKRRE